MDPLEASRLVTDEYSAKILVATFKRPRSAIDLSREYAIPIAACYRRIHALEKAGLIRCTERALTQKGKRISMYMSQLKNAYIFFENGRLRVRFQMSTGVTKDFGGIGPRSIRRPHPPRRPCSNNPSSTTHRQGREPLVPALFIWHMTGGAVAGG